MRICVCVDMRYGVGMLGKMYMNRMDTDIEMESENCEYDIWFPTFLLKL